MNYFFKQTRFREDHALLKLAQSLRDSLDMHARCAAFNRPSRLGVFFMEAAARREQRLKDLAKRLKERGIDFPIGRSLPGHFHLLVNEVRTWLDAVRTEELLRACQHRDIVLLKHYDAVLELAEPEGELSRDLILQRAAIVADLHEGCRYLDATGHDDRNKRGGLCVFTRR